MINGYKFINFFEWYRIFKDIIDLDVEFELYILDVEESQSFWSRLKFLELVFFDCYI